MEFLIDEVPVFFPYPYIYPEQYTYMVHLKRLIDARGTGLLEMPCGTGKTVCVLSLLVSYQLRHRHMGRIFYCSRTVPEIEAVLQELKRVVAHAEACLHDRPVQQSQVREFLGLGLSSRPQLCVHSALRDLPRAELDAACRAMAPDWRQEGEEGCKWREGGVDGPSAGVMTLEEARREGEGKGFCPYYWARQALGRANLVAYSYQYVLNPKIFDVVTRAAVTPLSVLVFDEAHNIDNVCIEALTVRMGRPTLEDARAVCASLERRVREEQVDTQNRLKKEYDALVNGLRAKGVQTQQDNVALEPEEGLLDSSLAEVPIPGALRRAGPFLHLLQRLADYFVLQLGGQDTRIERCSSFLWRAHTDLQLPDVRALRFVGTRLQNLLKTLRVAGGREVSALRSLAEMVSLLAMHSEDAAFVVIRYSPQQTPLAQARLGWDDGMLQLCCLDASLAMRPVSQAFGAVVITSATLSPMAMFPKILQLRPQVLEVMPMSSSRRCILPLIVVKGGDQALLNTKYKNRDSATIHRNYAQLITELAQSVPDGMIVFFPSYLYMETCVASWHTSGLLQGLLQHKLVFIETRDARETSIALRNYQRACDTGRGAVLLCVARGKVSEGVDFSHHHGRCVVCIGLPFQYTRSAALQQRLLYLKQHHQVSQSEYLTFDAIRQAAQCSGRVIRSKSDYAVMVFADSRYNFPAKQSKLPDWIKKEITTDYTSLSTDVAVQIVKQFVREMAQPWELTSKIGKDLWAPHHIPGNDNAKQ